MDFEKAVPNIEYEQLEGLLSPTQTDMDTRTDRAFQIHVLTQDFVINWKNIQRDIHSQENDAWKTTFFSLEKLLQEALKKS